MPSSYREGGISLSIDATCDVRWDAHRAFTNGLGVVQNTKAVDLVALLDDGGVALIELKDFRGYRIQNAARLTSGALALEVAAKVHDTLAAMTWAVHREHADKAVRRITEAFYRRDTPKLLVVLWLDEDRADVAVADALRGAIDAALKVHARVVVTSLGIESKRERPLRWLRGESVRRRGRTRG